MQPFNMFTFLLFFLSIFAIFRAEAFFCDFETDLCGITQDNSDTGDWVRISYTTGRYEYRRQNLPLNDHTFGNSTGHYMFNTRRQYESIFRLVSPTQAVQSTNNNTVMCLQFWYYMQGNTAELNVYLRINSSVLGNPVWSRSGNRGSIWRAAQVQIQENSTYQVIFEGSRQWWGGESIGIDDVMIINSSCQARDDNHDVKNVSCSFETWNLCGYSQDLSDDFNWHAHNGATATIGTGPSRDHTLGSELGFYMYVETSVYPRIEGHKARLISPVWTATKFEQCIEFWYHMYGSDVGALSLYIRPVGSTLPASPAVRLVGHHTNIWLRATYVMNLTGSFELVFEAFRGSGIYGDIAIDDVLIHDAPCANKTKELIAEPLEFHKADCNFEYEDLCNYTQDIYDDFDWIRKQGPTTSRQTGPETDHTYRNEFGHYMYIEASQRRAGMTARLMTPILTNENTNTCVFFYYHMYGQRIDFLKVYKKDFGGGLPVDPLFVRHGNQGNIWKSQKVDIEGQTEYFQIVFEGSVVGNIYGDIAIDDIVFHNTSCDKVKVLSVFNSTTDCNFDDNRNNASLCGFIQSTSDDFDWQLRNGSTDSTATGPSADHTHGDTKGQYLYIEASNPRRPNERAKIVSPLIEPADHLLCFKFWYHMKGEHVGRLNVYRRLEGSMRSEWLWTINGDQSDRWIEAMLPINYYSNRDDFIETNMRIILEGVIGTGHLGDIAIDDIKLESHYCFPSDTTVVTLLACDFEAGITKCGFSQDLSDVFDWKTFNISDESQPGFVNYAIAIGRQNNFAYLNMAGRKKGDLATLATMTTTSNGTQRCLSFKYLMQGDVQQQLNVYSLDSSEALGLIGVMPNKRTSEWKKCQFELPVDQDMSKILFEGVVGFEPKGFIALDDVTINIGGCIIATTLPDNNVPSKPTVLGNDGIGVAAKLFISFTIILIFLILLAVGVMGIRRKYIKRAMQTDIRENQANIHFTKDQNVSSDLAVDNPHYEVTRLDTA
ncbi:MAM and LDL-receptor class A domain-containing protein 1-like [Anneissia japonica]|uniref:MAM and LDL-receptor class A domain-containing protein 1-like n=1 Tax=Anneissia japonica TaxID=1529436 RepID=UPI0014258B35|nr:MAM and LDL-receptor class A domain-containing protein 1-like [Anneissia japonica]